MKNEVLRHVFGVGGVTLFLTAGLGLSQVLSTLRNRPLAVRLAYSYLLGVAFVAGALYVSSYIFGVDLSRKVVLSIVLIPAVGGLIHWLSTRGSAARRWSERFRSWKTAGRDPFLGVVTAAGILVSLGVVADAATNPVTDYDGRMTWCLQAKYVRAEETVTPRALRESKWYVTNRGYPLLLPLAQVAVQQVFATPDDDRVIRPLYAAFFPVSLLIIYEGAARLAGRRPALTAILVASTVPFLAFWRNGGAAGTYSDFPLACFFSAGVLLLLGDRNSSSSAMGAGALLAACVVTKQEGLVLSIAAVGLGVCLAYSRSRRRGRDRDIRFLLKWIGLLSVPVMSALALRMSWSERIPTTMVDYVTPLLKGSTYIGWLPRLLSVTPELFHETFNPKKWSIFWAVVLFAMIAGRRAFRRRFCRLLLVVTLAPLALGCVVYGIAPDPHWLAKHTWSRFLEQASLLGLVLLSIFTRESVRGRDGGREEPEGSRNTDAVTAEARG